MKISLNPGALSRTRWYEYVSRFAFGGAMTALAGILAKAYGPRLGGLFLAFPAIFPASATLIESHQKRKKAKAGGHGTIRGRKAAAVDATGASLGAFGLITFAVLTWKLLMSFSTWMTLLLATIGWLFVSVASWRVWKYREASRHKSTLKAKSANIARF